MLTWLRKSVNNAAAANMSFDSIATLQAHLDFKKQLHDYVEGTSTEPITSIATCNAGCLLGKWLHSEGGRNCKDIDLINALCGSCEEFYEAATNAVMLSNMGYTEMAKAALQGGGTFFDASDRFQLNLAKLHQQIS